MTPQPVAANMPARKVHVHARPSTFVLVNAGLNSAGQLGANSTANSIPVPTPVVGTLSWITVSAGVEYACGLASTGTAYCWGKPLQCSQLNVWDLDGCARTALAGRAPVYSELDRLRR